jgi:beta-lactamase class C
MMINRRHFVLLASSTLSMLTLKSGGARADEAQVRAAIDEAMKPAIAQYGIPGVAVGVTLNGARTFVEYGLASQQPQLPVTRDTLFELGSISKTFTATLATLAEVDGKLKLTDTVGQHMPELKGSPIGDVRLVDLGTHTAGGFPLQLPDAVETPEQLIAYYRAWKPEYAAGTMRVYANPSVALLGIVAARATGESFAAMAERRLFPALGLKRTFINVPEAEMASYAWGTNREGKPVRAGAGPIAAEAWGVTSNTIDMLRYLEVQMGVARDVPELIWEQYPAPVALEDMMNGNSTKLMGAKPNPARPIEPAMPPRTDVIFNKTGSTGGFGAYVFGMPEKQFGIVLLANKFYPNEARTKAGYTAMARLVG